MRMSIRVAALALSTGCGSGGLPVENTTSNEREPTHEMSFGGPSMEPGIADGDRFELSPAASYGRGEVVVYLEPEGAVVAKRIVAIAGDTVAMVGDVLILNGVPVPTRALGAARHARDEGAVCFEEHLPSAEPYVTVRVPGEPFDFGPVTIPEGQVFVLGDHRDRSNDSRNPRVGAIPMDRIAGRVVRITGQVAPRLECPTAPTPAP